MKKNLPEDASTHAEETPSATEPRSFGTWLRRQREGRKIDLRAIADESKVSMSYLQAFEEDRFEVLPATVFAKGFLRQYATYVGLDPEEVINFYLAARRPKGEEEPPQQPETVAGPERNYGLIAVIVIAGLIVLVWLLSYASESATQPVAVPEETSTIGDAVEAPPVAVPLPPPTAVEQPGSPLLVTLDFRSDCWVEASVDGRRRVSELKVQGESLLLAAEEVVEFKIGDAGAVQVEVNGLPFDLERVAGTSVRNVRIDLETAAVLAAGGATAATALPPTATPAGEIDS